MSSTTTLQLALGSVSLFKQERTFNSAAVTAHQGKVARIPVKNDCRGLAQVLDAVRLSSVFLLNTHQTSHTGAHSLAIPMLPTKNLLRLGFHGIVAEVQLRSGSHPSGR